MLLQQTKESATGTTIFFTGEKNMSLFTNKRSKHILVSTYNVKTKQIEKTIKKKKMFSFAST